MTLGVEMTSWSATEPAYSAFATCLGLLATGCDDWKQLFKGLSAE